MRSAVASFSGGAPLGRRRLLGGMAAGAALTPSFSRAQLGDRRRRIGLLVDGSAAHAMAAALPQHLAALGYVEGRTIAFETRFAEGRVERLRPLALELVRAEVDVIVAHFTPAVRAAQEATARIPIVMAPAGAPVELGLVASLSRPGGNVTGVTNMAAELGGRRLQLLKDVIPDLRRVAVLASALDSFSGPFLYYMQQAGVAAAIDVDPVIAVSAADFDGAFELMARRGAQAVVVPATFEASQAAINALAARHRMAVMGINPDSVRAGGLISITADPDEIFSRAAALVDRILKGASPATLPVEQPTRFRIAVNQATARALGVKVPTAVLAAADEVVE